MTSLATAMMLTFWLGLLIIIAIDVILAIFRHRTFSNRAALFGKGVPTAAYAAGLLPTHFWYNFPLVTGWVAGVMLISTAVAIIAYGRIRGEPMHPFVAFTIGLPMGMLFFPN